MELDQLIETENLIIVTTLRHHEEIGLAYMKYTTGTTLSGETIEIEDNYEIIGRHEGTLLYLAKQLEWKNTKKHLRKNIGIKY